MTIAVIQGYDTIINELDDPEILETHRETKKWAKQNTWDAGGRIFGA